MVEEEWSGGRIEIRHSLTRALALVLWDCSWFCLFGVMTSSSGSQNGQVRAAIIALYLPITPSKFRVWVSESPAKFWASHWLVDAFVNQSLGPGADWLRPGLSPLITLIREWITLIGWDKPPLSWSEVRPIHCSCCAPWGGLGAGESWWHHPCFPLDVEPGHLTVVWNILKANRRCNLVEVFFYFLRENIFKHFLYDSEVLYSGGRLRERAPEYLYHGGNIPYRRNRSSLVLELKDGTQWIPRI